MLKFLKKLNFNQYIAILTTLISLTSFVLNILPNFENSDILGSIIYTLVSISFCILYVIKTDSLINRTSILEILLIVLALNTLIFEVLHFMQSTEIGLYIELDTIFKFMFFLFAILSLRNIIDYKMVEILGISLITITLIDNALVSSVFSFYTIEKIMFILFIILISYDQTKIKNINRLQYISDNIYDLNNLKELLDLDLISNEDFKIMKDRIMAIYKF